MLQLSADVFACNLNPEGEVEILDTWNVHRGRNNIPDTTMDTFAFSSLWRMAGSSAGMSRGRDSLLELGGGGGGGGGGGARAGY